VIDEAWSDITAELERRWEAMPKEGYGIFGPWKIERWERCQILRPGRGLVRDCPVCGQEFMARDNGHAPLFCTEACAKIHRAATHVQSKQPRPHVEHQPRACEQCGASYTPHRSDSHFCSTRCRVAHHRAGLDR
jgi:endogenous inhibitor of DNA gyrase (YacG/DUF329 family)